MDSAVIDSHTHLWNSTSIEQHMRLVADSGHCAVGIACTIDPEEVLSLIHI